MGVQLRIALFTVLAMTVLTGILYPLAMTGMAQLLFPAQANGSLLFDNAKVAGSTLIGQPFDDPRYFWPRPSATTPFPYNAAASSGSNYGPLNEQLRKDVAARIQALHAADPDNRQPIPVDLVTASASGLDPHISPAAARYQGGRVARLRGLDPAVVERLIVEHTRSRQLGVLGEPVVNVLLLNRALDRIQP